jgi:hypothetical protein
MEKAVMLKTFMVQNIKYRNGYILAHGLLAKELATTDAKRKGLLRHVCFPSVNKRSSQ